MQFFNPLVSLVGTELLVRDPNPNATHTVTHSKTEYYESIKGHTSYHENPVVTDVLGQYYGGANQPPAPAGASASGAAR